MSKTYPIAEVFYSIQGEGGNSGIPMIFLRFAGCTVGKPYTLQQRTEQGLAIFQNECTIYDGRKFPCDTNYTLSENLTESEIVDRLEKIGGKCAWVSITGGEPLMHDIESLLRTLRLRKYKLHIDTSGTIPLDSKTKNVLSHFSYIVVSPKYPFVDGYVNYASEFRFLVDEKFEWESIPQAIRDIAYAKQSYTTIWLSPVNFLGSIDKKNVDRCVALAMKHPHVRVSTQIHKIFGVR